MKSIVQLHVKADSESGYEILEIVSVLHAFRNSITVDTLLLAIALIRDNIILPFIDGHTTFADGVMVLNHPYGVFDTLISLSASGENSVLKLREEADRVWVCTGPKFVSEDVIATYRLGSKMLDRARIAKRVMAALDASGKVVKLFTFGDR